MTKNMRICNSERAGMSRSSLNALKPSLRVKRSRKKSPWGGGGGYTNRLMAAAELRLGQTVTGVENLTRQSRPAAVGYGIKLADPRPDYGAARSHPEETGPIVQDALNSADGKAVVLIKLNKLAFLPTQQTALGGGQPHRTVLAGLEARYTANRLPGAILHWHKGPLPLFAENADVATCPDSAGCVL